MAGKIIAYDARAREGLKRGVDKVANAVRATLGPRGRNVVLERGFGGPNVTKDGVTVAKEIELEDKLENLGAELVKEIASKTEDVAGDGTTSAVVLAQAMLAEGFSAVASGANPVVLKRGIDKAMERVVVFLDDMRQDVSGKRLEEVASISANEPAIGKKIAEVFEKVGKEGVVTVEESQTFGITHELVEGMQFDRGYLSPYMITDPQRMEAEWEKPSILITDQKISSLNDILPLLEKLAQAGKKDLVIIAEDVEGEALATLVVNKLRGTFNALAIKAPGFGDKRKEMLQDIAIVTGGELVSEELGLKLENVEMSMLGEADRVVATKDTTTIVGGKGPKQEIEKRVSQLKAQINKTESDYESEKLQERLAKLAGGVAVIRVGAATETEMKEAKYRVEDAVSATRAALEEGIVPGGGVALLTANKKLQKDELAKKLVGDEARGLDIALRALERPLRAIAENAGKDGNEVLQEVLSRDEGYGYDAERGKYVKMVDAGIIDPLKVVKTEVMNAASIVGLILITAAAVVDVPEKDDNGPAGGGGGGGMPGMGGMPGGMGDL